MTLYAASDQSIYGGDQFVYNRQYYGQEIAFDQALKKAIDSNDELIAISTGNCRMIWGIDGRLPFEFDAPERVFDELRMTVEIFISQCEESEWSKMYCGKCGTLLDENSLFCGKCGARICENTVPKTKTKDVVKKETTTKRISTKTGLKKRYMILSTVFALLSLCWMLDTQVTMLGFHNNFYGISPCVIIALLESAVLIIASLLSCKNVIIAIIPIILEMITNGFGSLCFFSKNMRPVFDNSRTIVEFVVGFIAIVMVVLAFFLKRIPRRVFSVISAAICTFLAVYNFTMTLFTYDNRFVGIRYLQMGQTKCVLPYYALASFYICYVVLFIGIATIPISSKADF